MVVSIILLYMILASTFTLAKSVLFYTTPIFFIGLRMVLGGTLLLGYLYFFRREQVRFEWRHWRGFAAIMLFHIYIAYITEFWALAYVTSSKACLLYNLSPFVTALFAYWWHKERMTLKKWLGLIVGITGFLPILISAAPATEWLAGSWMFLSMPELALLVSVVSSAYGWIIMKKLVKDGGYSPLMVNGVGMVSGGLLAFVTSLIVEGTPSVHALPQAPHFGQLGVWIGSFCSQYATDMIIFSLYTILLIVAANIIFYNLYGHLLTRYSATFLSFAGFTCPMFAALYGWLFLGEEISRWFFLSVLIVVGGLYLFYQDEFQEQNLLK
jgi:drug/metabolite transporter (DMT)-like permease